MITNEQIENGDYSVNDVADLKYRLEIAIEALNGVIGAIEHDQAYKAREWAINDLSRIEGEHMPFCSGEVSLHKDSYGCMCALIAGGEDGVEKSFSDLTTHGRSVMQDGKHIPIESTVNTDS